MNASGYDGSMSWLGSLTDWLFRHPHFPTLDYYLLGAFPRALPAGLSRIGPHSIATRDMVILVRYATLEELRLVRDRRPARFCYVIDDMIPLAKHCPELPESYRRRLATFAEDVLPRILDCEPDIVAPRTEILELFPGRGHWRIDPSLLTLPTAEPATGRMQPLRLAFLGTRSHAASLPLLSEIVAGLERRRIACRLTIFFGAHLPERLARSPLIDNRAPLSWPRFRKWQQRSRFDVLMAPLPDTVFNRGRSLTKLYDAAAVGAAALCSARAPFSDRLHSGEHGLLLPDEPDAWCNAIEALANDRIRLHALAAGTRALAKRIGAPERLRQFWLRRLALD